jgi:hypothetical protein
MEKGAVFTDAAGSLLAITKALFTTGADKEQGEFKWDNSPMKSKRQPFINFFADTIMTPDEIWWAWAKAPYKQGKWLLKRRYLKVFEIEGAQEYMISAFEWGKTGWTGSTTFIGQSKRKKDEMNYFNKQRVGRLIYKK